VRGVAEAILAIAYPLLIVWALSRFEPRVVAGGVLGLLALRASVLVVHRDRKAWARVPWSLAVPVALVAAVSVVTALWNDPFGLLLAPVFVNAALLASFALSLRRQPIVETLARLQVDRLAPAEIRYCRRVTRVWCGFFVLNGATTLVLALSKSIETWAFYTGFLSYCLMGLLFAGEYVYRHARFRRYVGGPADALLCRLFAPGHVHEVVRTEGGGEALERIVELEVPTGLACWPGHFPGQPMLPGVLQVDWVLREIERWRGRRPSLVAIEGLKFKRPALPGDSLVLELACSPAGDSEGGPSVDAPTHIGETFEFRFCRGDEEISHGRIRCGSLERGAASFSVAADTSLGVWPAPALILLHADPMIWLRRILAHDAHETRCLVAVADLGGFRDSDGGVGAHVALEWMAQCVAAHAGLERRARGESPALGLLLGSKRVRFARPAYTAGERFRVVAVRGWGGVQGAVSFECRVETIDSGERVADARLSCFMPGEAAGDPALRDGAVGGEASVDRRRSQAEEVGLRLSSTGGVVR
jgi:uncharacterized membrane protein/predicted hotdog family 3-hydroxylacyl-ACP dehydratase